MALNSNFFNLIDTCCPVGSEYKPKNFGYEIVEHLAGSRIFEFPATGTGGVSIIQAAGSHLAPGRFFVFMATTAFFIEISLACAAI
jgi:hypothetical protein